MRGRRIADVGAGRELAVLILEHAVEDEKFLPAVVRMRGKMATGCVANDRCGSGHLIAYAIQHAPLDPGHRRSDPGQSAGVDGDATGKISIEFHAASRRR